MEPKEFRSSGLKTIAMKTSILNFLIVIIVGKSSEGNTPEKLVKMFEWNPEKIQFVCENKKAIEHLILTGKFVPKHNVPVGMAIQPEQGRIFLAIPRWKHGVLSTLNWAPLGTGNLNEPLRPYPNWEANNIIGNCKSAFKIISVVRIYLDSCGRLWVIDSGCDDYLGKRLQIEKPKLLIFDTTTNNIIRIHTFDSSVVEANKASLGKIVVDVIPDACDKAFAYITDVVNSGLIVYDFKKDISFRIESNYIKMEPMKSTFILDGKKIYAKGSIDGISLSPRFKDGFRNLYVSVQTSNKQFITTTKWLHNLQHCKINQVFEYVGQFCEDSRPGGAQVVDEKTNVMFFSDLSVNAIRCWNGDLDHFGATTQDNIFVSPELTYISDMVVTPEARELVVMSNDLRSFTYTEKNVIARVFVGAVDSLIEGTACKYRPNLTERSCCY